MNSFVYTRADLEGAIPVETEIGGKSTGSDCINSFQLVSITELQHVKLRTSVILDGRVRPKSIRGSDIATINCLH